MTTIKVTCPECGDVDLEPSDIGLTVTHAWCTYSFTCGECGGSVTKPAAAEVVDLLTSAGVSTTVIPAEALERHIGTAIGYDDVLDFALALGDERAMQQALSDLAPADPSGIMEPRSARRQRRFR